MKHRAATQNSDQPSIHNVTGKINPALNFLFQGSSEMTHSSPIATLIGTILVRGMPQMATVKLSLGFFILFLSSFFS